MNTKLATQLEKNKSTELAFGDTKIKISDGEASVYKQGKLEAGSHISDPVSLPERFGKRHSLVLFPYFIPSFYSFIPVFRF